DDALRVLAAGREAVGADPHAAGRDLRRRAVVVVGAGAEAAGLALADRADAATPATLGGAGALGVLGEQHDVAARVAIRALVRAGALGGTEELAAHRRVVGIVVVVDEAVVARAAAFARGVGARIAERPRRVHVPHAGAVDAVLAEVAEGLVAA